MLVADVVRTFKFDYFRVKALSKERRTYFPLPTLNPRTMCLMWHLRDLTANTLLLKKKYPKLNSSSIQDWDRSIMIPLTRKKKITDSFKMMKSQLKLRSSKYWERVTMKMSTTKKMSINLHISWAELSKRIPLRQDSISKPVTVGTDTSYLHKEASSSSLIKCKQVAVLFNYNKYKTIVILGTRDSRSMIRNSLAQEKRLKGRFYVCLQKSKSRLLSNIKTSQNRLRPLYTKISLKRGSIVP